MHLKKKILSFLNLYSYIFINITNELLKHAFIYLMSSTTVSTLALTSQIVNMYLTTTMLAIGVLGGLLNVIVFLSLKTFRDSPCAFYLTVMSFTNIGQLFTTFLTRIVLYRTGISWTSISEPFCKFRWFFIDICALVSFTCLCLATIDQFLATSSKIKWQQYSNIKLSRYLCLIFIIVWMLITSPIILFYHHVRSSTTGQMTCALTNPEYQIYITYVYLLVLSGVLPIFITMLFGLLAYRNIRQIPYRTVPLVRRELDKQLTTMVLIQVILNFTNITPSTVISVYTSTAAASKDALINAIVQLISQISIFLYYLYFAVRRNS